MQPWTVMQETGKDTEEGSQAASSGKDAKSFCVNKVQWQR